MADCDVALNAYEVMRVLMTEGEAAAARYLAEWTGKRAGLIAEYEQVTGRRHPGVGAE